MKTPIICIFIINNLLSSVESIYGGTQVKEAHKFPFIVQITGYYVIGEISCAGTILNHNIVLTAAHCVREDYQYFVKVGHADLTSDKIREIRDHSYIT